MKPLTVEINPEFVPANTELQSDSGVSIMFSPPIDADYYLIRVKLGYNQAIVGFPKFGTIGIGFAKEQDWNTNLPYTCDTEKIYNHIACNKGDKRITRERCMEAIRLVQHAAQQIQGR